VIVGCLLLIPVLLIAVIVVVDRASDRDRVRAAAATPAPVSATADPWGAAQATLQAQKALDVSQFSYEHGIQRRS
jgi:hypothetical protein